MVSVIADKRLISQESNNYEISTMKTKGTVNMTKDTLYILISMMMNMNASANQNEIVSAYTAEDAKRLVWSTYGMHPTKKQIEETFIKLIWHTHNALCLHVGGVE